MVLYDALKIKNVTSSGVKSILTGGEMWLSIYSYDVLAKDQIVVWEFEDEDLPMVVGKRCR